MSDADVFFDTSVLLYLVSNDDARADRVEELLANGGRVSVQVLNEFAAVGTRKMGLGLGEVCEILQTLRQVCEVAPLTVETHEKGLALAERYGFSIYDSMIAAAALLAGARQLYSEDLQHGQLIERTLRVVNPFRKR